MLQDVPNSPNSLHFLLDEKIKEVISMRGMLAKELKEINATAQVKDKVISAIDKIRMMTKMMKGVLLQVKILPEVIRQINNQWGNLVLQERQKYVGKMQETQSKCKRQVQELEIELKKQYQITHNMKQQVQGLKKLIDQYMSFKDNNNVSPIKTMTQQKQPILEVIVQEQQITSTKRGDDPNDQTIESILRRNKTEEKFCNKEYITLGNLHDIIRTNSAQRPLTEKKRELNGIDNYYKKNRVYNPTTEQSRLEIALSDASSIQLDEASIQHIGKILSRNAKEEILSKRRDSAQSKKSRTMKEVLSFMQSEDEERRAGSSFRERVNKQNIGTELSKERLTKEEKYKTMIKNILTCKDKESINKHKKKQFTLNVGDRKMEVKYEGSKRDGKRHGKGVLYFTNGLSYEGEFKNGVRSGYGVLRFNHIEIYNGNWQNDTMTGEGRIKNCSIIGTKKKDLPSVLQRWISFSGEFKCNKFHGSGTLYMAGGQKYLGMFKNGLPCNQGTLYRSTGEVQFGVWKGTHFLSKY